MDMKTFKILEFAVIFGALGWFWWGQRRPRSEETQRDEEASKGSDDASTKE